MFCEFDVGMKKLYDRMMIIIIRAAKRRREIHFSNRKEIEMN